MSAMLGETPTEASTCSGRGGRGGRGRTVNRTQKPCICCELMSAIARCMKRTQDVVFRQLKHHDKRELDWVKKMENERMTDKQERGKQLLLKVEALCSSHWQSGCSARNSTLSPRSRSG